MIKKFIILSTFLLTLSLFSCASNTPEKRTKVEPYIEFTPMLKSDGSKTFTYTQTYPKKEQRSDKPPRSKRGRPGGKGGARDGSDERPKKSKSKEQDSEHLNRQKERKDKFYKNLDEMLTTKSYCKDGYEELEYRTKHGDMQVTGECVDKASEEDRQKFFSEEKTT